ncbi:MAG TPA: response regulator transcription factor [Pseudogracilibacillus sp.]|nr:response regulator transcription factor [Pseudogracilibacillus sp.]
MKPKILLVDDEIPIITLLQYNVEKAGFQTDIAQTGPEALDKAINNTYALIILDIMLPGIEGTEVCRQLRERNIDTPILMLTAKGSESDKVTGLDIGADDYLTKPFSPREMIARVQAILRRVTEQVDTNQAICMGQLTIFPNQYEAKINGDTLDFTRKEFDLLLYLAENKGLVLSREQLLNAIWDYAFEGSTRIVDVHISHLREKIEANAKKPRFIQTIHGLGYKMVSVP